MSPSCKSEEFHLNSISKEFTEKTLVDILNKALNKNDCILAQWEVTGGPGAKGDGYLSEMVRMKVQAKCSPGEEERNSVNLVIKSLPSNIGRRKTFRSTDFFSNEIAFYKHVAPVFEDFQKKNKVNYDLFPKCFAYFCDGKEDFIVLEDLSPEGYSSPVRQEGMNFEQCKVVMSTLANYHGISFALKDQDLKTYNNIIKELKETYFDIKFSYWVREFHKDQIACVVDALDKEYPNAVYKQKLLQFADENYFQKLVALVKDKTQYSVINHGDSWIPNFLMNYKNGAPKSVKLIDFQLARDASLVLDVLFFFYSGTTQDLRVAHFDELIKYYYKCLCDTITELGSEPAQLFPESAFYDEIKKYAKHGLGFSFEAVPFTVMENEDTPDLDTIQGDEAISITAMWQVRPIKNQKGRLRLADNVRHAVENGFL